MQRLIKKMLFTFDPEQAHSLALNSLALCHQLGLTSLFSKPVSNPQTVMNLTFRNRVGLAPGFDQNGEYVDALNALGFGFIEIGGVTPKAQPGNPTPRIFRLTEQEAIINRMGFHNKGMEYVASQLAKKRFQGILGINIAKNMSTPLEKAVEDYVAVFRCLHSYASYMTLNISSPNTPKLRELQRSDYLANLLRIMKNEQQAVARYVPLVVKISPDLTRDELAEMAALFLEFKIDGVIATNTSIQRPGLEHLPLAQEAGGLSGRPLHALSAELIRQLHTLLGDTIPIIASGGVMDVETAMEKLQAGAKLLQIYSGFIFRGQKLICELSQL